MGDSDQQRYFIELAYKGSAYHGWQIQQNALSVQELLNQALSTVCRVPVSTVGCGRTDTGVHARQLYAHFDLPAPVHTPAPLPDRSRFLHQVNSLLPADIALKGIFPVPATAHARFDAIRRSYEYHLHFWKDPFLQGFSWQLRDIPDPGKMDEAATILLEYEDFACFSKSHTQVFTNNCRIEKAHWEWLPTRSGQAMVFHISADRFLRNMVRAIVGTLLEIGHGKQPIQHIRQVIEGKNRSAAGASVPAEGLYLTEILYPETLQNYLSHK